MNKLVKLLKKKKVILTSFLVVFIVTQATTSGTFALGPQFNSMAKDHKTLRLANATAGDKVWQDPVAADYGDRISFNVYYHNTTEGTVAKNTRIRVDLPQKPATKLVSQANLWADNADLVTDTAQVNINGSTPAILEYIPGSALWYPNQNFSPKPDPIKIGDGITENGVNIGDITGCWEYAGFVVFQAKIIKVGQPDLAIEKQVKNITKGETKYVKQNTAYPGDELNYKITLTNTGNDRAFNIHLKDVLPKKVSFIAGSLKRDGESVSFDIFSNFTNIGHLLAGKTVVYEFRAKIATTSFPEGTTKLVNVASVYADSISKINSDAATCVTISPKLEPDLTITKKVKNLTKPDKDYLKQGTAWVNDVLEYKISFSNPGMATAENVVVKDVLPKYVDYISSSTKLFWDGVGIHPTEVNLPDGITEAGVNIGNLTKGRSGYILFRVKVASFAPAGTHKLVNLAKIWAENVSEKKDTAISILTVHPPLEPDVNITKKVRNLTKGETKFVDQNSAYAGDILEYKIIFTNSGKTKLTGIIIKDTLPKGVEFISGSASLYLAGGDLPISDQIIKTGALLPDLNPGKSGYLTFKVKTSKSLTSGKILTNTGEIFADCGLYAKDSAQTIINGRPIKITITQEQVLGKKLVATGTPTTYILLSALIVALFVGLFAVLRKKKLV